MAKNKLGTLLISNELRDIYIAEVKLIIEKLQASSLSPALLNQLSSQTRKKLQVLSDNLTALKAQLLIELHDGKFAACTVDEAELAIGTARRLQRDFVMMMQPNLNNRKKIVRDFFKFARNERFSRWTKTLFAGGWATLLGFAAGALLFTLAFHLGVGIALGVAAGIGVVAGVVTAVITYRRAKNPHEINGRGKKVSDCLASIVNGNNTDLENYILLRIQHIADLARAERSAIEPSTMRSSADPRASFRRPEVTESKSAKSRFLSLFGGSKSDGEQLDTGKENRVEQSAEVLNRKAAFTRAATVVGSDMRTTSSRRRGMGMHRSKQD